MAFDTEEENIKLLEDAKENAKKAKTPWAKIILFIKQVIGEFKKVTPPTKKDLIKNIIWVIIFVAFMIILITFLDYIFGILIGLIFAGSIS